MPKFFELVPITLLLLSGCARNSEINSQTDYYEPSPSVIDAPLGAVTATTDVARTVGENAGNLTEKFILFSSGAMKQVIISIEELRKMGIQTFGSSEVKKEVIGPFMIRCPYCKRPISITKRTLEMTKETQICPHCEHKFLINWKD